MIIKIITEGILLGALLVLLCAVGIRKGAVNMVFLYHRDVQDRCVQNGLITRERIWQNRKIFKGLGIPLYFTYLFTGDTIWFGVDGGYSFLSTLAEDNELAVRSLEALEKNLRARNKPLKTITGHTGWTDDLDFAFRHRTELCKPFAKRYKKLSANLDQLKATGYPFELKIFPELGHGGLAGEHPARFVEEVTAAWQKSLG